MHTETVQSRGAYALRAHVTATQRGNRLPRTPFQALPPSILDLVLNFIGWVQTRFIFLSGFFHVSFGRFDEASVVAEVHSLGCWVTKLLIGRDHSSILLLSPGGFQA